MIKNHNGLLCQQDWYQSNTNLEDESNQGKILPSDYGFIL